ncbi:MAG: DUF3368 domain-containing protein [Candidatus Poribacteria bacterium]|nr:DUF3368 domain-containing protein [Candidatus Poribacteria bacterium]
MSEGWILNASPIITLAKIGRLNLLVDLAPEICIPQAVFSEIIAGPDDDPGRRALEDGWGKKLAKSYSHPEVLGWSLGAGESEVLSIALEKSGWMAVIDDATARACARSFGVPVIGTLGVVLRAKRRGLVTSASKIIRELSYAGLYLDDQFVRAVLKQVAGEDWQ